MSRKLLSAYLHLASDSVHNDETSSFANSVLTAITGWKIKNSKFFTVSSESFKEDFKMTFPDFFHTFLKDPIIIQQHKRRDYREGL